MDEAKEERILCVISESESESSSDDSDTDPSFFVLEETRAKFSNLAIKKKAKARLVSDSYLDLGSNRVVYAIFFK